MGLGIAIVLPFGLVFFASGLLINAVQLVTLLLIWPCSRRLYRHVNYYLSLLLWAQVVFIADWWGGMKPKLFVEPETLDKMGKEAAIVVCNHRSDVDWLVGWGMANRVGCLAGAKAVMKKSSRLLPVFGWSMWFQEYIFLARNWAVDQAILEKGFSQLASYPRPSWLCLFVEGTRFTQAKLRAAQEFAASKGLPVPQHTLVPKTKGFVTAVHHMRHEVKAVYDITFAPVGFPMSMAGLFQGRGGEIHVRLQRYDIGALPEDDEGVAEWCRDVFIAKDKMLAEHERVGTFPEELYKPQPRPRNSLLITCAWSLLVWGLALRALVLAVASGHVTALSVGVTCGGLALLAAIMVFFLRYSQAEPTAVLPRRHQD
ncbi:lysophosphatidyl acyltransferase 2 [Klebsormidium nitens]|uniref:1-acylglycerol-3-phosphate O-acyltransferase n=1 Tax=Klebsormidium nitens TaxID=105231 RepID=A0A1Y1HXV6_KLENI|nr:lysophosphatidyl acyltransferase 2 [Klebsormidium nitens]|eukprot:GAQ81377.1 lysophosphatidyl acyltransferase 2 [Klebsormidium nitens]